MISVPIYLLQFLKNTRSRVKKRKLRNTMPTLPFRAGIMITFRKFRSVIAIKLRDVSTTLHTQHQSQDNTENQRHDEIALSIWNLRWERDNICFKNRTEKIEWDFSFKEQIILNIFSTGFKTTNAGHDLSKWTTGRFIFHFSPVWKLSLYKKVLKRVWWTYASCLSPIFNVLSHLLCSSICTISFRGGKKSCSFQWLATTIIKSKG